MTGSAALDLLMSRLSRTNVNLRAKALLEMIHYQENDLEGGAELPDFLITRNATVALTAANAQFTLPTDFLRELNEDESLWILDDDGVKVHMEKMDYEDGIDKWGSDATSDLPTDFALEGLYGYVFPTPTVARTLKMNYYARATAITDAAVETVWLKHASDLIIGGAGRIVTSLHVKDEAAAMVFLAMEQKAQQRLNMNTIARAEAGRSRRMG